MKPKYEHTYAELTKLKNQIRVELNKIRPYQEQITCEKPEKYSKRLFHQKYSQTSISEPPEARSQMEVTPTKKYFQKKDLVNLNQNKSRERRHYEHSYIDKVDVAVPISRKTSSYFNVKPEIDKGDAHRTSLIGIGKDDRSLSRAKSGKRIIKRPSLIKI
jgi:hypothetical protein